nr:YeeE/YedE thiosulfate transporter family protein [Pontivivens insulae]
MTDMETGVLTAFTPWASLGGGVLLGLSTVMLMALLGRIAGISGITAGAFALVPDGKGFLAEGGWRVAFVAGLVAAPMVMGVFGAGEIAQTVPDNLPLMAVAGVLVGLGAGLGSGCTSGHGVCGLARLSPRSLASVLTFMASGAVMVAVLRHGLGG